MKGLMNIKKSLDEKAEKTWDSKTNLRLKDGDIAVIRILSDIDKVFSCEMHSVKRVTASNKTYNEQIPCKRDSGECKLCEAEIVKSERIYFWIWCHHILHTFQNPLAEMDEKKKWKKVKNQLGEIFYKEVINGAKLLVTGPGHGRYIVAKFVNAARNAEGTLCDRDYKWVRSGKDLTDTNYDLMATEPSEMSEDVKKAVEGLKDLEEVVMGPKIEVEVGEDKIDSEDLVVNEGGEEELF